VTTRSYISLFYISLFYIVYTYLNRYQAHDFSQAIYVGPAIIFNYFNNPLPIISALPYLLGILILLSTLRSPHYIGMASITALFHLFFFSYYSFGSIYHSNHSWLFATLIFLFINTKASLKDRRNIVLIRIAQAACLTPYITSGLWKVRGLDLGKGLEFLKATVLNHIAYAVAEGNGPSHIMLEFISNNQNLIAVGYVVLTIFQITCILPIIINRLHLLYGFMGIAFHISTMLFMGIHFNMQIFALVFFLIFTEILLINSKKLTFKFFTNSALK
jgi:hypothetical protein